jgi:hypothetical protein
LAPLPPRAELSGYLLAGQPLGLVEHIDALEKAGLGLENGLLEKKCKKKKKT